MVVRGGQNRQNASVIARHKRHDSFLWRKTKKAESIQRNTAVMRQEQKDFPSDQEEVIMCSSL